MTMDDTMSAIRIVEMRKYKTKLYQLRVQAVGGFTDLRTFSQSGGGVIHLHTGSGEWSSFS
jgi:hypothetical protein